MKYIIIITTYILAFSTVYSQLENYGNVKSRHEMSIDFSASCSPILSKAFFGASMGILYKPAINYATGFSFAVFERRIPYNFSYTIGQPIVDFYELGWINQLDLFKSGDFKSDINLNNGIALSVLGDNSIKVKKGKYYQPKEIATDYFFLFEPGVDLYYRIYSRNYTQNLYLTASAKYRLLIGDYKYGTMNQFSNFIYSIGFSVAGFTS